jgi:hypothetical protein
MGGDSVVGKATGYWVDGPEIEFRWGGGAKFFAPVQTGPWGLTSLLYNGYWVIPRGKGSGA